MKDKTIGFIGGGRITKIFLQGFKNKNIVFEKIIIFDPNNDILLKLKNKFSEIIIENENVNTAAECDIVVLAVHPPILIDILTKIKNNIKKDSIIISLAPKITIEKIKSVLEIHKAIARVIPSASGIISQGINPVAFADSTSEEHKKIVFELLRSLGKTFIIDEPKIEAYAMISAMGPTYFWFQFNKLKELGIKYGMDEKEVKEVISEMIKGTINTLFYSDLSTEEVMDLIPVKPIGECENTIKGFYDEKLNSLFEKIKTY